MENNSKQKINLGIIISIAAILVVAGGFYYKFYIMPKPEPEPVSLPEQLTEAQFLDKLGHPEQEVQFSGAITKIDFQKNTLSVKVNMATNFLKDLSESYRGKIYAFVLVQGAKVIEATQNQNFKIGDEARGQKPVESKEITFADLKIGQYVIVVVPVEKVDASLKVFDATKIIYMAPAGQ